MYLSSAIALIVVGAILTYAVELNIAGIDINMIGMILMIAGVVGAVASVIMMALPRRREREIVRER